MLIILLLVTIGCVSVVKINHNEGEVYHVENKLSFFDPYEIVYANGKYQGYTYESWLRKPENIRMLHETFKKIGYDKLIGKSELTANPNLMWAYINRPLDETIDSLIITYPLDTIESKYYREFWQRRIKEGNEEVVFEILLELEKTLLKDETIDYDPDLVNDTLYNLVIIDRLRTNPSTEQALKDFEYLKSIGMYGSAYNLLYENQTYENVRWKEQELVQDLKTDSENCCPRTWVKDNTK